jgi:hypothetical protein
MGVVGRFHSTMDVIKRNSHDPYIKGRAMEVAGGALVADGLIGLENPLSGKRKRAGIFGAFMLIVFGVVWVAISLGIAGSTKPYAGGETTTGTVTAINRGVSSGSNGSTSCSATVAYEVNGTRYEVGTSYSSSDLCSRSVGSTVDVSYRPDAPDAGRPLFPQGFLKWFPPIGYFVIVVGVFTFFLRLAELSVGAWLFFKGRALAKRSTPTPFGPIFDELKGAWSGKPAAPSGQHDEVVAMDGLVGQSFR